jgi:hypothetical protein
MLKKHGHLGSTLWLCSPLTRALETMTLAAPQVEQLAAAQQGVGAGQRVVVHRCAPAGFISWLHQQMRIVTHTKCILLVLVLVLVFSASCLCLYSVLGPCKGF